MAKSLAELREKAALFPAPSPGQGLQLDSQGRIPERLLVRTAGASFPLLPIDGQEFIYTADATNGVQWRFRYNAGSASLYKWEFIGGPPSISTVATREATAAAGAFKNLTTDGPAYTTPFAGDWTCEAQTEYDSTAAGGQGYMGVAVGNTNPVEFPGFGVAGNGDQAPLIHLRGLTAVAAGSSIKLRYFAANGATDFFQYRVLRVTPVRLSG